MLRRKTVLLLLLTILATGYACSSYAQEAETDNAGRKEQRRKEREERRRLRREAKEHMYSPAEGEVKVVSPVKKKQAVNYPQTAIKARYRIDVLMQLYLDDLVKGGNVTYKDRIPDKAQAGMAFYQGISMAADSLKKAGFKVDIYIHDIASAAETPEVLVTRGMLDSADLIIGAVPAKDIPVLAEVANRKHINFISALANSDGGVKENNYFTMLMPSLRAHCEWIAEDVAKYYAGQKVSLLYRKSVTADSIAWKHLANADGMDKAEIKKLSCKVLPSRAKLLPLVDSGKANVIVLPIMDNTYADSILHDLVANFPDTHFEVYGMPSWGLAAKKKTFPGISFHSVVPFSVDASSPVARYVARTFKRDYGGRPTDLVYRGYEIMFWYANLLKQYGTVFNEHYSDNATAPFTRFNVKTRWDNEGNMLYDENIYLASPAAGK